MRLPHTVVGLVTAMLIAFAAYPVSAQDEPGSSIDDLGQLDGIVSAVSRSWSGDGGVQPPASPVAVAAGDQPDPEGAFFLIGVVMAFDNDANAERAFEIHRDYSIDRETEFDEAEDVVTNAPISGLGDNAHGFDIGSLAGDADLFFRHVMAQDGPYVYIVTLAAGSAEATDGADRLAEYLVDEGEPDAGDATFSADGASTGGDWGFFPAEGHQSLSGLVPTMDDLLYPAPDEGA